MDIGQEQHSDLVAEVGQRGGQAAAVLGTLVEAGARLAAEESRRRERVEQERDAADQRREDGARRLGGGADLLARHAAEQRAAHDQRVVAQANDPAWVAHADLFDLATVWRTARVREHQDPVAGAAAEAVEQRLREMYPRPMDLYDEAVAAGTPRGEAMRKAAEMMATSPVMRAHGGGRAAALDPAAEAASGEAFAAALEDERNRLAAGLDPQDYAEQLQRLGPGGEAAARALRDTLAARAAKDLGQAQRDAATPDDPATPPNEHQVGLNGSSRDLGAANSEARTAAQVAGQFYPEGTAPPAAPAPAAHPPADSGHVQQTRTPRRAR